MGVAHALCDLDYHGPFTAVDKDQSGSITKEEAVEVPGLTAAFPRVDSNADANLSEDEYAIIESGKMSLTPGS